MNAPITKAPETQPRERHPDNWTYPFAFLEEVEKSMPDDDFAPGLEGIELALLGYEKATNTRLHVPGESAQSSYDSLARELETAKAALNELPAADVTDEALFDAIRCYGLTAHLSQNADELKKALLFRNTLSLLYAKLIPLRAALKPSNEVGTIAELRSRGASGKITEVP